MKVLLRQAFDNDKTLSIVFCWLTRIGAAPKFGGHPIGWYQQHQCACIKYLEDVRKVGAFPLRCRRGIIQSKPTIGKWHDEISATQLWDHADNFCRTGKY